MQRAIHPPEWFKQRAIDCKDAKRAITLSKYKACQRDIAELEAECADILKAAQKRAEGIKAGRRDHPRRPLDSTVTENTSFWIEEFCDGIG